MVGDVTIMLLWPVALDPPHNCSFLFSVVELSVVCHTTTTMESEGNIDPSSHPAITYSDIQCWSTAYDLPPERATAAIRRLVTAAYGQRPGLLAPTDRRHCLDIQRLANVMDQLTLLKERDVLALSFRCPTRMLRYQAALIAAIGRGNTFGADADAVSDAYRTYEVICRFTEQVTAFYQGLS